MRKLIIIGLFCMLMFGCVEHIYLDQIETEEIYISSCNEYAVTLNENHKIASQICSEQGYDELYSFGNNLVTCYNKRRETINLNYSVKKECVDSLCGMYYSLEIENCSFGIEFSNKTYTGFEISDGEVINKTTPFLFVEQKLLPIYIEYFNVQTDSKTCKETNSYLNEKYQYTYFDFDNENPKIFGEYLSEYIENKTLFRPYCEYTIERLKQ